MAAVTERSPLWGFAFTLRVCVVSVCNKKGFDSKLMGNYLLLSLGHWNFSFLGKIFISFSI